MNNGFWDHAKATVQASSVSEIEIGKNDHKHSVARQSVCKICWQDQNRVAHHAEFEAFEESPLYQLCEGDTVVLPVLVFDNKIIELTTGGFKISNIFG